MNLSKHAACFVASRLHSLECCARTELGVCKNFKWLLDFSRKNQGLKMFGKLTARCLTLDPHACLPPWRYWEESGWFHVSPATQKGVGAGGTKSRPQNIPGLRSGLTLSARGAEAQGGPDFNISNLPSSTKVWGKTFLPLENHGGFTFLNKTEKKASTENEFRGITILFVEDIKGPRYIKESRVCIARGSRYLWGLFKH